MSRALNALVLAAGAEDAVCVELLALETGARQKLRCDTSLESLGFASLSPDDRNLAYTRPRARDNLLAEDIWIRDRTMGTDRVVTNDVSIDWDVMWTPDGRALALPATGMARGGLFTIAVNNGVPAGSPELVRDLGRSMPSLLGFTRDGTLFVRMLTDLEDVLRTDVDLPAASLGNPGRAEPTALDESNRSPDWSPDGQRFAYIAGAWRDDADCHRPRARGTGAFAVVSGRAVEVQPRSLVARWRQARGDRQQSRARPAQQARCDRSVER